MIAQGPESNRLVTNVDSSIPELIRTWFRRLNGAQRKEDQGFDVKIQFCQPAYRKTGELVRFDEEGVVYPVNYPLCNARKVRYAHE